MLSDFVEYLQYDWKIGYSGIIGYMNALGHLLDFRRTFSHSASKNVPVFLASEVYLERVKCFLSKKMNFQCNKVVSVDYLNNINCWATLTDFTKSYSIPCRQVKANYLEPTTPSSYITPYDF